MSYNYVSSSCKHFIYIARCHKRIALLGFMLIIVQKHSDVCFHKTLFKKPILISRYFGIYLYFFIFLFFCNSWETATEQLYEAHFDLKNSQNCCICDCTVSAVCALW